LYVETPKESSDKIALDKQRHLINNFKLATQLGAEVIKVESKHITDAILEVVAQKQITTVCIGKPHLSLFKVILSTTVFNKLLNNLTSSNIDLVILS
jgi:two-component system sensor histidine kinase KdpD